jgi:fused signal recognition particle receptor
VDALQSIILIVAAAQVPLLALAFVVEFSRRKARPSPAPELAPAPPKPAEQIAQRPAAPETTTPRPFAQEPITPEIVAREEPSIETIGEPSSPEPPLLAEVPPVDEPPPIVEAPPLAGETEPDRAPIAVEEPPLEPIAEAAPIAAPEPPLIEPVPTPEPTLRAEPIRIGLGLRRTRENFLGRIRAALTGSAKADEIYEGLEEALIGADVGVDTSLKIVEAVRGRLKSNARPDTIRDALKDEIERILVDVERPFAESGDAPLVILLAGVNGVGKTTTVAKLAAMYKSHGTVVVGAADTFRAAAIEQLEVWCDRAGADLIKQKAGSDPAAVAFDAVKAAVARKASVVLIDTAGRLQTKTNLMEELKKIGRVVGRELPGAPHETWLVLDATTGQNALSQAKNFGESANLTGVVLAKLDSTAKGGVIVAIAELLKLPVRFVGLGEGIEDLRPFDAREFVNALFLDAEESREEASGTYAA